MMRWGWRPRGKFSACSGATSWPVWLGQAGAALAPLLQNCGNAGYIRRFRRVYNDPSELAQVLQEILENDGNEALRKFLYKFDISIDLILPPRKFGRKGIIISKGNLVGELPEHIKNSLFSDGMLIVFKDVMAKLYSKLEAHCKNPQANKIENFIMIYSALFSVMSFVNNFAYSQLDKEQTITPERWSESRDYYDLIFLYLKRSWRILWGNEGYSILIGEKLKEDERSEVASLENYIYEFDPDYLHNWYEVAKEAVNCFDALQSKLRVKTISGNIVVPKVFKKNVSIKNRKLIKAAFAKSLANCSLLGYSGACPCRCGN